MISLQRLVPGHTARWFLCLATAVVLVTLWTSEAHAQLSFVAEADVGSVVPVSEDGWHPGVQVGARLGVGIDLGSFLLATPVGVDYGEAYLDDVGAFGRLDVVVCPTFLFKLKPILLGWQIAILTRITSDPRDVRDPNSGEEIDGQLQLGTVIGPVLWWPLRRWLALSLRLTWEYTAPATDFEDYFWPQHSIGWSTGLVFTF